MLCLQAEAILKEAAMISEQNAMLLGQIEADSQKAADLLEESQGVQQVGILEEWGEEHR